ncbi:hypothetical protein HDU89_008243 [Geranomyces variabilis]|nr:hypothetical protein HDU89_008243 [Geranomyces variabilis]
MDLLNRFYFVDQVVDKIWEELVVYFDIQFYLTLALVNRTFKAVMYQPRRRREMMRAHAAAKFHAYLHGIELKRQFSNPLLPTFEYLASLATTDKHAYHFRAFEAFVTKNVEYVVALLPEAPRSYRELVWFDLDDDCTASARRMKRCVTSAGTSVFFFGDLFTTNGMEWKFAYMIRDYKGDSLGFLEKYVDSSDDDSDDYSEEDRDAEEVQPASPRYASHLKLANCTGRKSPHFPQMRTAP